MIPTVYHVAAILSLLSCLGSGSVVFSYISFPELRKHPTIMVVFLSICDMLYSLKFIAVGLSEAALSLEDSPHKGWCIMGAMWGQFWGVSSISWNAMISLNVVMNLRNPFKSTTRFLKFYHAYVWSVALITTCILFSHPKSLGPNGEGTCGVDDATNPLRLVFYFPLLTYMMLGIFCLVLSLKGMADLQNPKLFKASQRRKLMGRLILVVLVFICCWAGPTIHRGCELILRKTIGGAFWYLDVGSLSIIGFINAIVWFTNPDFISLMREKLAKKRMEKMAKEEHGTDKEHLIALKASEIYAEFPTLDSLRRNDIISCLLLGIQDSVLGKTKDASDFIDTEEFPELIDTGLDSPNLSGPAEKVAADFRFFDYQPTVFAKFRSLDGISSPDYLRSLNVQTFLEGANLKVSDGKSGSFFCFSPDRKFIIKTVYPHEATFLNSIIGSLQKHFSAEKHTFIAKFYGFHGVQVPFGNIIHMVVMANVIDTNLKIHEVFDLKGSWINRTRKGRKSRIGLDLDFDRKIKLSNQIKLAYLDQIARDAKFLASLGIMDYSLLLGIHVFSDDDQHKYHTEHGWRFGVMASDESELYFMGIIDILQFFNIRKKVEFFTKTRVLMRDSPPGSCLHKI
eukprot:Phypoly_transcript_03895.p1 GENE.Phypoly_transcript_03895~~Phypoly_transcript_03895.p1  ORF type:complete len:624 (+),score=54.89 Phypoly_transcript_03895:95-1966(+)